MDNGLGSSEQLSFSLAFWPAVADLVLVRPLGLGSCAKWQDAGLGVQSKRNWNNTMKAKPTGKLRDGAQCKVIGGVHAGKSGIVTDINTSKTGHVTITVVQPDGERFKTLAKNVVI